MGSHIAKGWCELPVKSRMTMNLGSSCFYSWGCRCVLSSQQVPGILLSQPQPSVLGSQASGVCNHTWLFTWVLRIPTRLLVIAQEPSRKPRKPSIEQTFTESQAPGQGPQRLEESLGSPASHWGLITTQATMTTPSIYLLVFLFLYKAVPISEVDLPCTGGTICILDTVIHIFPTNWAFTVLLCVMGEGRMWSW